MLVPEELDLRLAQIVELAEREVQLAPHETVHPQPPHGRVDLRHRAVRPHVERVAGGQRTLVEGSARGLGVERLVLVHDEVRALPVAALPHRQTDRSPRQRTLIGLLFHRAPFVSSSG